MLKFIVNPAIPSNLALNLGQNPRASSSRGLYLSESHFFAGFSQIAKSQNFLGKFKIIMQVQLKLE